MLIVEQEDDNVLKNVVNNEHEANLNIDHERQQLKSVILQSLPCTPTKAKHSDHTSTCCGLNFFRIFNKTKRLFCCGGDRSRGARKGRDNVRVYKAITKSDIVHHNQFKQHLTTTVDVSEVSLRAHSHSISTVVM